MRVVLYRKGSVMAERGLNRTLQVLLLLGLLTCLTASAQAAAGELDPSFGSGGLVTTDFGSRGDFGLAVALQADGKIVAAGNSSAVGVFSVSFALARYNPNGSLDSTFGSAGTVLTSFGGSASAAFDVVVEPDAKIVVVGFAGGDFGIARYSANGTLDPTFGTGGLVTTDFGGFDQANGVALQPDGKIVVVGPLQGTFGVARYNPDGSLDSTFGSGGKVITDASPSFDGAFDVAAWSGKIVVGGGTGLYASGASDFQLVRYNGDGSLDSSFGGSGIVTTDFGASENVFGIAVTADGKITAAGGTKGASPGDFAVARYNSDGALDSTFDGDGKTTTDISADSDDIGNGVVVQPDGSITVGGTGGSGFAVTAFAAVRYTATGNLDTAFGSGGKATAVFGNPINNAFDIVAQPDGKVVLAGGTGDFTRGVTDFALARFLGAPTILNVSVDVKPDSSDNVIPLQSNGVIPVAILTTDEFDAASVEPASVCFGSATDPTTRDCIAKQGTGHLQDVNGDARSDLLLQYETQQTGIRPGDTQACLTGKTYNGISIEGCDRIVTK
jgi:uncharacterized delta-60 repeat protein